MASGRPRPTTAPHLQAEHGCPVRQDDDDQSKVGNPKVLEQVRELVITAKEKQPSLFEGQIRFGQVAKAVEESCGIPRRKFAVLASSMLGCVGPADGLRRHCSDLLDVSLFKPSSEDNSGKRGSMPPSTIMEPQKRRRTAMREGADMEMGSRNVGDNGGQAEGPARYVEILQTIMNFRLGDIHELVGDSNSGLSIRVNAGINKKGNISIKALPKNMEGTMWRFVDESQRADAGANSRDVGTETGPEAQDHMESFARHVEILQDSRNYRAGEIYGFVGESTTCESIRIHVGTNKKGNASIKALPLSAEGTMWRLADESQRVDTVPDAEPCHDFDAGNDDEAQDQIEGLEIYVEILQDFLNFHAGDVYACVGDSNSGSSVKVYAGTNKKGNTSYKHLPKQHEGTMWRFADESQRVDAVPDEEPYQDVDTGNGDEAQDHIESHVRYVEILQNFMNFHIGDAYVFMGDSSSGATITVSAGMNKKGNMSIKTLPKNLEGTIWRFADESPRKDTVSDAEPCQDMDNGNVEEPRDHMEKSLGYVEILQASKKFADGDILEVLGQSRSGYSLKVNAGTNEAGNVKAKTLPKDKEGTMWRWISSVP